MKILSYKVITALLLIAILHTFDSKASASPQLRYDDMVQTPEAAYESEPSILFKMKEYFDMDSTNIIRTAELRRLSIEVDSVLANDSVTYVDIRGYASIDGPVELNRRLAKGRAKAVSYWLTQTTKVDPSYIRITSNGEDWRMFDSLVSIDPKMPMKEEVLRISTSNLSIMQKQYRLKALDGGEVWAYLAKHQLPAMRIAEVKIGGFRKIVVLEEAPVEEEVEVVEVVEEVPVEPEVVFEPEYWTRKMYIKTNAPAWLLLWINAAWEIDLAPHWSFNLPIYYSGFNYFKRTLKFRTFSVVPEVRWWPRADNMGFFLNGHLGMNLFNYAKGGDWRYQTYKGHTPALGGGIGLGYRWYFCKNHRWSMEAAVGAGVYRLDYSIFENKTNGQIVGRRKRTFFGVDQAALSFNYSFGVQRKEVKK